MTIPQDDWSGGRGMLTFDDDASRYYDGNNCDTSMAGKAILGPLSTTGTAAFSGGGTNTPGIFFEYKGALYFVTTPLAGTASTLYINGDRGAADSNTGALTTLIDATKTWTPDEWIGSVVKIIAGPGVEEDQNWRVITDNDTTSVQVSPAWNITHTTSTEYVIVKSDKWTAISCSPLFLDKVSDVAVAGDWMYFCYGNTTASYIQRYQEYNASGTWTRRAATESSIYADELLATLNADGGYILWGSNNDGTTFKKHMWYANVPPMWGSLYVDLGLVFPTDNSWDTRSISTVLQTVSGGNTSLLIDTGFTAPGYLAVEDLDEPIDITKGDALAIKIELDSGTSAATIGLIYDDVEDLGKSRAATKVLASRWYSPTNCYYYDNYVLAANKMDNAIDGLIGTTADVSSLVAAEDAIYIGFSSPFSALFINMANANSTNPSQMSLSYFDGNEYKALTIVDGTAAADISLTTDDDVTWTPQDDWMPSIVNNVEAYWVRMTFAGNLDVATSIAEIEVCAFNQPITQLYDGDPDSYGQFTLRSTDWLYVCGDEPYNSISIDMGGTRNVNTATMTASYFNGAGWASLTITDGTLSSGNTLGADSGSITFTIPYDWQPYTIDETDGYWVRFTPSADLSSDSGDINGPIYAYYFTVTHQNNKTVSFSGTVSGIQWLKLDLSYPNKYPHPDETAIKSVGIYASTDPGSSYIIMYEGWHLVRNKPVYISIPTTSNVTRLIAYGSSSGSGINPYVICEDGIFEIQQENDNAVVKLPIEEISALASGYNGKAVCTNDVYLYFNLGRKIERYYNGNLEDIGPDLDAGLPANRQGDISSLVSYPGRVYASVDAGSGTKYSSILLYKGNGWHEMYRAAAGESIYKMYYQAIPGSNTGRLWFSQSDDLKWIPVSTNPDTDTDYRFTSTGYIETGWMYAGMQTIKKVFDSLTVFMENSSTGHYNITASYQVDEDSSWTAIPGTYDGIIEENNIATTRPTGRRIRFKIQLNSDSSTITPELIAYSVDMYGIVPVKYQYTWTGLLSEYNAYDVGLDGNEQQSLGFSTLAEKGLAQLDAWVDNATVLTMNSRYSVYDNKTVLLTAPAHVPVDINSELQIERHVLSITCHDL